MSVIMVARHDASPFCQQPKDSCLDRLRVSLSTILRALAANSFARDSEIILVDYNPCHARTQSSSSPACALPVEEGGASRTSSHPRANTHTGFWPLAHVVRDMVDAPVYYMCICIYVGVCIYMCVNTCTNIYICRHLARVVCDTIDAQVYYMYICICVWVCIFVCLTAYANMYIRVYIYVCIHTYVNYTCILT